MAGSMEAQLDRQTDGDPAQILATAANIDEKLRTGEINNLAEAYISFTGRVGIIRDIADPRSAVVAPLSSQH